ncbi:unnamed protein product [Brassica rapa subsp. trilocularis]
MVRLLSRSMFLMCILMKLLKLNAKPRFIIQILIWKERLPQHLA